MFVDSRSIVRTVARGMGLVTLAVASTLLVGCIAVGGTSHAAPRPTVGQELVDLKKAADCGAISPEEYERLRQDAMKGHCEASKG